MRTSRGWRRAGRIALAAGAALAVGAVSAVGGTGMARAQPPSPRLSHFEPAAVSWGWDLYETLGQSPVTVLTVTRPVPAGLTGLGSGSGVVQVSAGVYIGMALTADGRVWTWGDNQMGQLGNSTPMENSPIPAPVPGLSDVTQIAAGGSGGYALRSDGTVWALGDNGDGELGDGSVNPPGALPPGPVQVQGLTGITQIAAGGDAWAMALRSDGTVWAWGSNEYGQLGISGVTRSDVPVQVPGLARVTRISAGTGTGVALSRLSHAPESTLTSVYAWGWNLDGELGNGTTRPVLGVHVVPGLPQIGSISAGGLDVLAVGEDGSLWGWGGDRHGELGNAPTGSDELRPVETLAPGSRITQVSAGSYHSLALRSDGTVLAFGDNEYGQLGTGSTSPSELPAPVPGLTSVTQVSAGFEISMAIHQVLDLHRLG
jgi:alpha-tubulin suppressor-like RCC1 family protein